MNISNLKGSIPDSVLSELTQELKTRTITKEQLSAFLANGKHESANWTAVEENLNYSAQGLANTFPARYAVDKNAKIKVPNALAKSLNRKPQAIANNCYANRNGNGNEASGDGWRYKGRGYLQITGKSNYILFDATVLDDITNNPDLVATKYPLKSAFFYFDSNKLWVLASNFSTFSQLVKRINGEYKGLDERTKNYNQYLKLLS